MSYAIFICFAITGTMAQAQTYLVNAHAPKESRYCEVYKYNGSSSKEIRTSGSYSWYGGLTIGRHSVLINEGQGYATFDIGGKYEKFTFVMGPAAGGSASEGTGISTASYIMVVKVDGEKVIDKVLHPYDIPQRYSIDVKGAKEITFSMAQGEAKVAIAEAVLWKSGETPRELQNQIKPATKPAQLIKDIPCYFSNNAYIDIVAPEYSKRGYGRAKEGGPKSITIGNQSYTYALLARLDFAIMDNMTSWAYFNLQKKYKTFTFKLGTVGAKSDGSGWVAIAADGKTIYEKEWNASDVAEQVTLNIDGCESLKIWTEDSGGWSQRIGFADMMVYPAGMEPARAADAEIGNYGAIISKQSTIDPKLKSLPDICPLMSNIAPYSRKSSVDKQIYDGSSDYITFSMGGVKFNEGFILYKRPWVLDESTSSDINFDLGEEFDYLSFTTGFLGKSWYLNKDVLKVYADDKPVLIDTLYGTMMNKHYIVPLNKCRKLRFECRGYGSVSGSSAYGCSDLVLYRGEPKTNELFVHERPECPQEIDLLDLGGPYMQYVTRYKDSDKQCLRGETMREYYTLPNGEKVYKGFILQTSTHFSLDAGVLGVLSNDPDDPKNKGNDATGSLVGAAAVGSTFVTMGAVGGSYVGATMTSAAAFMVLAAGGTALESSCAAFNTYGEYNSVTFTIGCLNANPGLLEERKSIEEVKKDKEMYRPEKLLIGANGKVIAELSVFAAMEPQTITLPITGCEQLMFFLVNTNETSAIYVFYDIKLSKENKFQVIPSDAKAVKPYITYPRFEKEARSSFMENTKLQRQKSSGAKNLDSYLTDIYNLYDRVCDFAKEDAPCHFETYYLEGDNGLIYKAICLKSDDGNKTFTDGRFPSAISTCEYDLKKLSEMRSKVVDLSINQASAALDLPSLGLGAIAYGKIYKGYNKALKNCKALIDVLYNEKMEQLSLLRKLVQNALIVEGRESTDYVLYNPMFKGESVPAEVGTSPLRNFYK